jgi:RNA polymerase sigma factor (sigma-70 family)
MAADVVQSAFANAWETLQKRADVKNVRAWLYAIARNAAIDELRLRRRLVPAAALPVDESQAVLAGAARPRAIDPEVAVIDREVVELVWTSAAALSPKEYTLLDLHVRRGLSADELASNLGIRKGAVHTRLSRLKDSLEESVTSALLMRRGRRDCSDLDALLSDLGVTELTRAVRKAVQEHVRECDRCQESKRRYVSPAEILAGLAPIPASPDLRNLVWERINRIISAPVQGGGLRTLRHPRRWWATATLASKGAAIALLIPVVAAAITGGVILSDRAGIGGVNDPENVHSISHEIREPSTNNVVTIVWTREPDARGYSVDFTSQARDLPDDVADLPGDATGTSSPPLEVGSWYFHLRTFGADGAWTSTVHLGPFVITTGEVDDDVAGDRLEREASKDGKPPQEEALGDDDDDFSEPPENVTPPDEGSDPSGPPSVDPPIADTTPPEPPTITSGPPDLTNDATPTWAFTGEPGADFGCTLTQAAVVVFGPSPCSSPTTYDLILRPDGTYTLSVTQTDAAGNVSDPATDSFTLDTTPPDPPTITSAPPDITNDLRPTWAFMGEPGASFECTLTQAAVVVFGPSPCSSPITYDLTLRPDGTYTLAVTQTDAAGNVSDPATDSFTLDTTPPEPPTITSAPPDPTSDSTPTWTFTGEPGASFACTLTREAIVVFATSSCSSPTTYDLNSHPDATYTLAITQTDAAGNVSAPATDSFTLSRVSLPPPLPEPEPQPSSEGGFR